MSKTDDIIGIALGILGGLALAELLKNLSKKQCPYCKNYNNADRHHCQFCGGYIK